MDRSCWLCGTRLYPGLLVADGGSACTDVRWYCLDMRSCTERWTSRLGRRGELGQGVAGTPQTHGEHLTQSETAWPAQA